MKRSVKRKSSSGKRIKYLITVLDENNDCVAVRYLGYDFMAARAAVDSTCSNPEFRGMTLRTVRSINRKVTSIRNRHLY